MELFGSLGINGTDDTYGNSLDNLASDSEASWQVGVAFSRPLDNSFAEGEVMQAEASLNQAKTTSLILEQDIRALATAQIAEHNTVGAVLGNRKPTFWPCRQLR